MSDKEKEPIKRIELDPSEFSLSQDIESSKQNALVKKEESEIIKADTKTVNEFLSGVNNALKEISASEGGSEELSKKMIDAAHTEAMKSQAVNKIQNEKVKSQLLSRLEGILHKVSNPAILIKALEVVNAADKQEGNNINIGVGVGANVGFERNQNAKDTRSALNIQKAEKMITVSSTNNNKPQ